MITDAESLKANEHVKRRILRLQQVREQSKNIAKNIRHKVNEEKNRLKSRIESANQQELNTYKKKTINHLRSDFDNHLAEIGAGHASAALEDIVNEEWNAQKEVNRIRTAERSARAATVLQKQKTERKSGRHQSARSFNLPSNLRKHNSKIKDDKQIQQNFSESETPDNLCSNIHSQFEINTDTPFTTATSRDSKDDERHADKNPEVVINSNKPFALRENFLSSETYPQSRAYIHIHPQVIIENDIEEEKDVSIPTSEQSTHNFDPSVYRVNPVETIRQLKILEELSNDKPKGIAHRSQQQEPERDSTQKSKSHDQYKSLHTMSKDNPFTSVISDHIRNRRLHLDYSMSPEKDVPCSDKEDIRTIRELIHHTRYAPGSLLRDPPSIPNLPENYTKHLDDKDNNYARRKKTELLAATDDWLPSSKCADHCISGVRCPSTGKTKEFNSSKHYIPSKQCTPSSRTAKYVKGKHAIRCRPQIPGARYTKAISLNHLENASKRNIPSPSKRVSGISFEPKDSSRTVRYYDHANKFESDVKSSKHSVERLPKEGKNAFELAREEIEANDRVSLDMNEYYKNEARRIRGMRAMEKVRAEKDRDDLAKELDILTKEERLHAKKVPDIAFMDEHRIKEKEMHHKRRMDIAFEELTRPTKVHKHPIPISALVVQPEHKISKSGRRKPVESDSTSENEQENKRDNLRIPEAGVNVATWDVGTVRSKHDDLDEIPMRDSDSTVKSIVIKPSEKSKKVETMSIGRVLSLVEKQREQLLRELARMGLPRRVEKTKTHRKTPLVCENSDKAEYSNSTTDEQPQIVTEKPKPGKQSSALLKNIKIKRDETKRLSKEKPSNSLENQQNSQVSTSSTSSISFQGFQILIEVKKGAKTSTKETTVKTDNQKIVKSQESQDSSTEMSIKASQVVTTKEVIIEKENNSRMRFDSSGSTSYMSPPEKFTTHAIETLFGRRIPLKCSETQTDNQNNDNFINNPLVTHENESENAHIKTKKKSSKKPPPRIDDDDESESTVVSHKLTTKVSSSFTQNDIISRSVVSKGVQTNTSRKSSAEAYQAQRVLQVSNNKKSELDPRIQNYVKKLLEISKAGVHKLNIDVSDVPTPSSSIVNVTSNLALMPNPTFNEKVERLKHFIDENYSLLEQIELENKFHRNYGKNIKTKLHVAARSDDASATEVSSSTDHSMKPDQLHNGQNKDNFPHATIESREKSSKPSVTAKRKKVRSKSKVGKKPSSYRTKSQSVVTEKKMYPSKLTQISNTDSQDDLNCDGAFVDKKSANELDSNLPSFRENTLSKTPQERNEHIQSPVNQNEKNTLAFEKPFSDLNSPHSEQLNKKHSSKETSPRVIDESQHFTPPSLEEQQKKIDDYMKLSAECSQRISSLSQMLEQVRKEKQATLSSNSSPIDENIINLSKKVSSNSSQNELDDIGYVPILGDIPKPQNGQNGGELRMSQIDSLRNHILTVSQSKDTFLPNLERQIPFSPESDQQAGKEDIGSIYLESFDNSYQSPEKRPKPPAALIRHPIMRNIDVDAGTPHELSTIIEVDTPITARNTSTVSKNFEGSPSSIRSSNVTTDRNKAMFVVPSLSNEEKAHEQKERSLNDTDEKIKQFENCIRKILDLSVNNQVEKEVEMLPFISFREFVKQSVGNEIDGNLIDSTLKANTGVEMSSMSDDSLPDIIPEMLKRNLIKKPFSNTSSGNGSVEDLTSSSSGNNPEFDLPHKKSLEKPNKLFSKLDFQKLDSQNKNNPSISGINAIPNTSSSSTSDKSIVEFENALKNMGIGWGVSTLRKTKETMALSSTSSSLHRNSPKENIEDSQDILAELANLTGSSVGLSTLLGEIGSNDFMFKEYTANVSNSSLNQELDKLLQKISSRVVAKSKDDNSKSKEKKSPKIVKESPSKAGPSGMKKNRGGNPNIKVNLFSEEATLSGLQGSKDKTQHRTSTPVDMLKGHSSSSASNSQHASNGLFSIESDLSSVKNISNIEKNTSADDRDTLYVPNMSLKFGKLFESVSDK